ncbi:MAG: type II secretion system protein M [Chromatiaceae bacterium]|nr:type II secretion system protein M [Chromatiaceae bacterium]MCF8004938.1 type II secretion system protein M [Chromatiaceae bacterium]MCF8015335.1 type II secretion system protein M [Chromatiaceae bacterium]
MLLLPLIVVALVAEMWLRQISDMDNGIQADAERLERYQRLVATLPNLRVAITDAQSNDSFKIYYFDADTQPIAGAQVQREVQDMIRQAGARPVSAQVLPGNDQEVPPRVRLRVQFQCTTDQLFDLLYRAESARPFLIVDQMSIRSQARSGQQVNLNRRRQSPIADNQELLTVRLDLFGYFMSSVK